MLIIFLILFVVITVFLVNYKSYIQEKIPKKICKESVAQHARLHIRGMDFSTSIKCPVDYRPIGADKDIKSELAYYMADCWDKFGEGRLKLFDEEILSKKNLCVICNHITFKEKTKIDAKDFMDFLKDTPFPSEFDEEDNFEKDASYYTYLSRYKTKDLDTSNIKLGDYNIDTSVPYATVMTYAKKGNLNSFFYTATGIGAKYGAVLGVIVLLVAPIPGTRVTAATLIISGGLGAAGGASTGGFAVAGVGGGITQNWDAGVLLVPYKTIELKKLNCDYLPAEQKKEK